MRRHVLAAFVFGATLAHAQEPRSVSVEEFLTSGPRFVGHRVLITGCSINRANRAYAFCAASNGGGAIFLDGRTMNGKSLVEAMKHCAPASLEAACTAVVAGVVHRGWDRPQIRSAVIIWQAAERHGKWSMVSR